MPDNSDAKRIKANEPMGPGFGKVGIGEQIRNLSRHSLKRGLQDRGQGHERRVNVERGEWFSPRNDFIDAGTGAEDPSQGRVTFADYGGDTLFHQFGVADELNRVPKALLGVQQDSALAKSLALPKRLWEISDVALHLLGWPAQLIFAPASRKVAHEQKQRPVMAGFGVFGSEPNRLVMGCQGLIEAMLFNQGHAEIVVRLNEIGIQANSFAVTSYGFSVPILGEEGHAQIVVRGSEAWIEPDRFVKTACRLRQTVLVEQRLAQAVVRFGAVRRIAEHDLQGRDRLLRSTHFEQQHPQRVASFRVVWLEVKSLQYEFDSAMLVAAMRQHGPQQIQR